jgi:tripeptide aminopeptidase
VGEDHQAQGKAKVTDRSVETIAPEISEHLRQEVLERFLRYAAVETTSSEESERFPTTDGQHELGRLLVEELAGLGIEEVEQDGHGYVYARLHGEGGTPLTLLAHLDTSPSEAGRGVCPVVREHYDGGTISFPDDPDLLLTPVDSPELLKAIGDTVITAAGKTLLGADDKAGIAAIMAMVSALTRFPALPRPELRIVFTPDEEVGRGTERIDMSRIAGYGYTVDGGRVGEIATECFHALKARIRFKGVNVHPGQAKGKMVNAVKAAAWMASALPEQEAPEHTEAREGFYHVTGLSGDENNALLSLILRDFEEAGNRRRVEVIQRLRDVLLLRQPALRIEIEVVEQYRNMGEVISSAPAVVELAEQAVRRAGIAPIHKSVRGGTDGARLSFRGVPMPNLFTGGQLFHSRKEWVGLSGMQKAAEVLLHLCGLIAAERSDG